MKPYDLCKKEKELADIKKQIEKVATKITDMKKGMEHSREFYELGFQLGELMKEKTRLDFEVKKYRQERGMINPDMLMDGTRLLYMLRHGFCEEQAGCAGCPANVELDDCAGDCIFEMASYVLEDRLRYLK